LVLGVLNTSQTGFSNRILRREALDHA